MSYIQQTIKCNICCFEMNVALGTFGTGFPENCPNCKVPSNNFIHVSDGWNANNSDSVDNYPSHPSHPVVY